MSSLGPLAESARRRLKELARRAVGRVRDRIRLVLLASRGYSLAQIAAIFECDEATVKRWVERSQQEGDSGLQDRPRSGRPRTADAVARSALCQAVEQTPAQLGYRFGYWTTGTLAAHLAPWVGNSLSAATVRRAWRRPAAPAGLSLGSSPPHLAHRSSRSRHHVAGVRPHRAGSRHGRHRVSG
jgi:transposase